MAWDDFGVFVAEVVGLVEGEEPAHCGDSCGGVEEGVDGVEDEIAGVDDVVVFEVDDEVVVGVSGAEVMKGGFGVSDFDFVCFAVDWVGWGDVFFGPVV